MANDWFKWKGTDSRTMGIYALELPPVTWAEERAEFETVSGRSGSVTFLEGDEIYDDVTLSMTCLIKDGTGIDAAAQWLRGSGRLELPNRPGGFFRARVIDKIELDKVIAAREARTFAVSFRADPRFWLLSGEEDIEITSQQFTLTNPGNLKSDPRITIEGSGDIGLELAGQLVRLWGLEDGIILDSRLMDALDLTGANLLNDKMEGDFIRIPAGDSILSWYSNTDEGSGGSVTGITVKPRWVRR